MPYRLPAWGPVSFQLAAVPGRLGQEPPMSGREVKLTGLGAGAVLATLSGAAAWVGIHTGLKESGILSLAGWTVGLVGGFIGATSLFGTLGLLLTPTEEIERAIREAEREEAIKNAGVVTTPARMPILETM